MDERIEALEKRVAALEEALAKKAFNTHGLRWSSGEFLTQEQADYVMQERAQYEEASVKSDNS